MKKTGYAFMLAAMIAAVACTKENVNEGPASSQDGKLIINAVAGSLGKPDAKAVGAYGYEILWEENDKIAVTDGVNQGQFKLIEGVGETLGKFEQEGTEPLSGTVTGYYPASLLQSDGTLVWPAEQQYNAAMTGIPMTASATIAEGGTNFSFKNLGGVLQLVLTSSEGNLPLKSITVSVDDMGISGEFKVKDDTAYGFTSGSTITLDCNGLVIGAAAKTVNIAIPAFNYFDMRLRFETADGKVCTMKTPFLEIGRAVVSKVTLALSGFKRTYPDYLSLTATGCDIPVTAARQGSTFVPVLEFEYSLDPSSDEWTDFTANDTKAILTLKEGQTVFFRGKKLKESLGSMTDGWRFDFGDAAQKGGRIIASGNVMSLLDPTMESTTVGESAFVHLFERAEALISAPSLPATTLGDRCYESMFYGCTNLTEAPDLPANTLKPYCYQSMFYRSGVKASAIMSATSVAESSCNAMYYECKSLCKAHPLMAASVAESSYKYMFNGCTVLENAPDLPATTLGVSCYENMFYGCKALIKAPALPATKLEEACYKSMFRNSGIKSSAVMNASELADNCCESMYQGCVSLQTAQPLPATSLASYCYQSMFQGCTALVEAPDLPASTMSYFGYRLMFSGCKSLTKAPALQATVLNGNCYDSMFSGCTALVKAPALPVTELQDYCYYSMFSGCTALTEAPELPARNLAVCSYYSMFSGCKSLRELSVGFTGWGNTEVDMETYDWVYGLPSEGVFYCPAELAESYGSSYIPQGWTVRRNTLPSDAALGTTAWKGGIEGMYIGDSEGKKIIMTLKNYGADAVNDLGTIFSRDELDEWIGSGSLTGGWEIPSSTDMAILAGLSGTIYAETGCAFYPGGNRLFFPYTHNVSDGRKESRTWLSDKGDNGFYWFRSDGFPGITTDATATGNYVRLVNRL